MRRMEKIAVFASVLAAITSAGTASAAETASATMTGSSLGGSEFQYNIALKNTSTTPIGTFWFSWIPGYDFMNVAPTSVTLPAGWTDSIITSGGSDGYSIEAYNQTGASGFELAGGATDNFSFDSTETLAQLSGNGAGILGAFYLQTQSYVYAGFPESDAGFPFNVTPVVPEPVSASIVAIGAGALMLRRRRA